MNLTPEQKNKLLAAAEIVDNGDMAVLQKILEFEDIVAKKETEFNDLIASAKQDLQSFKDQVHTEVSQAVASIPIPIDGKDYILTEADKQAIAKRIDVPVVEKVVETIIREQPITNEIIKEVAVYNKETMLRELPKLGRPVRDSLELLQGEERLDSNAVKGLPKITVSVNPPINPEKDELWVRI